MTVNVAATLCLALRRPSSAEASRRGDRFGGFLVTQRMLAMYKKEERTVATMRRFLLPLVAIAILSAPQVSSAKTAAVLFEEILDIPLKKGDFAVEGCEELILDKLTLIGESVLECVASKRHNVMKNLDKYLGALKDLGFEGAGFGPRTPGHFHGCRTSEAIDVFATSSVDVSTLGSPSDAYASGRMSDYIDGMRLVFVYNPGGC